MRHFVSAACLALLSTAASAVQFAGVQTGPTTWTYDLTYDPLDNYSVCQPSTTITVTGLSGVTAAAGPTSTDFTPAGSGLDTVNLAWTAQVQDGGTTVVWTHTGLGTGNFGVAKHVYGFTITATGVSGLVPFSTSGFARDAGCAPPTLLDISGSVAGPKAATATAPVPTLTYGVLALLATVLVAVSAWAMRQT